MKLNWKMVNFNRMRKIGIGYIIFEPQLISFGHLGNKLSMLISNSFEKIHKRVGSLFWFGLLETICLHKEV